MYLKDLNLLYVEDNKIAQQYLETLLFDKVKNIHFADNGEEGLDLYSKIKPDIVLCDICMPQLDGLQMSKIIKQESKDQPIILITGCENNESLKKAIELGIDSFISKPVYDEKVLNVLESLAKEIYEKKTLEQLKEIELNREKIELILSIVKEIGHHWKQPLSSILLLSSSFEFKKRMNKYKDSEEEISDINYISQEITKLSNIINKFELFDFKNASIQDIEKIIKISNPLIR